MKPSLIRTIYLYVFSGIGLVLFLAGIFQGVRFLVNVTQFSTYPLAQYEETQCDYPFTLYGKPAPLEEANRETAPSEEEIQRQEEKCKERQTELRQRKRVEDLTQALTFLVVGALVFIPHWHLARKSS